MAPWIAFAVVSVLGGIPTTLEVSGGLESRLDPGVLRSRLTEEGFTLTSPAQARLLLVVGPHARGVELKAVTAAARLSRIVEAPDEVWATERTFELAQRLSALAHEAAAGLPLEESAPGALAAAPSTEGPPERKPPEGPPPSPGPALVDSSTKVRGFGVVARPGFILRSGAFDFSGQVVGVLRMVRLEPLFALSIVVAPDRGGTALEFPLLGGVRVLFEPWDGWKLSPEVLLGIRLHAFPGDESPVRVDPALQLGFSARRKLLEHLSLGAFVAAFLSTARTHVAGLQVLWGRGSLGLVVGLDVEF
ncbi:MAG: hypothetical protein AB1938_29180 [Myxococcota bacterium]